MREIILNIRPGEELAFAAAFDPWLAAEPLATSVEVFGARVKVGLMNLHHGDGPKLGQLADDRPRAAALLRQMIPSTVVETASVEGRDWRHE